MPFPIMHDSEFMLSAPKLSLAPEEDPGLPEITLVGRSNVGKSSLLNCLFERKNLARTSNTPGKTRMLNFYEVRFKHTKEGDSYRLRFIDLPGYGFAKVSQTEQRQWRREFEAFLRTRQTLICVMQLIDARHGVKPIDEQMFNWLQGVGIDPLIVLTKSDKLNQKELAKTRQQVVNSLLVEKRFVLPFAAPTGLNRELLWNRILEPVGLSQTQMQAQPMNGETVTD